MLQAIQMATQTSEVYRLMQKAFEMFDAGKLKGAKDQIRNVKKLIEGSFSAKINHFKVFLRLTVMYMHACACIH